MAQSPTRFRREQLRSLYVEPELHQIVKLEAAKERRNMQELVTEALTRYFAAKADAERQPEPAAEGASS